MIDRAVARVLMAVNARLRRLADWLRDYADR